MLEIAGCNDHWCQKKDDCYRYVNRDRMKHRLSAYYTEEEPCYFYWPLTKESNDE